MSALAIDRALEEAVHHHRSGQLQLAEQGYRQVLQRAPGHPDALHLLGVAALQAGRGEDAISWMAQALPHLDADPAIHSNLGEAYRQTGRFAEAVVSFQRAVRLQPECASSHVGLGWAWSASAHWDEAIPAFLSALRCEPEHAGAVLGLGSVLFKQGLFEQAVTSLRRAVHLNPESVEAHCFLADALRESGQAAPAVAAAQRAVALNPAWPAAYCSLGAALRSAGRLEESIVTFQAAVEAWPNFADAHYNLATALSEAGRLEVAVISFRRALALDPRATDILYNLANTLRTQGALQEALLCYQKALQHQPELPEAWNNLGSTLKHQGRIQEALFAYREAVRLRPVFVDAHSNLLLTLHYLPTITAGELAGAHRSWSLLHESPTPLAPARPREEAEPKRPLRLGYVSPDFCEHPVAFFIEPLLAHHDRSSFEIFCYANTARPDATTERLRSYVTHWIDIAKLTDAAVIEQIRRDGIDLLVDLAGHTADHRLLVFAAQPAPVQATYLGYGDTTGLRRIQYRITDAIADPCGEGEAHYSETLVRLPEVFACFQPFAGAPPVAPLPALARGFVTFASLHTLAKLNDELLSWWARILHGTPGSRLLLMASGFRDPETSQRLRAFFQARDVSAERLVFATDRPLPEYLAFHAEADLLLDSYPFNGHTVACHALWMGLPVISLAGGIHCSRMVASVLSALRIPEWVAGTPDEYVGKAIALARDVPALGRWRETLRERVAHSPLTDGPRFAAALESAYRQMWHAN